MNNEPYSYWPPQFVRLHVPPLPGVSFSYFFPNSDGLFSSGGSYYAKPLASRRGLLLARITPTRAADHHRRRLHQLAVCHPRLLPPPPFDQLDLAGYALLPDADDPTFFRVLVTAIVVVSDSGDRGRRLVHHAYSFSSATSLWSVPIECTTSGLAMPGPRAATVDAHGTAHWLYLDTSSFFILAVVTGDATHAALTKLPFIEVFQREHFHLQQPLFPRRPRARPQPAGRRRRRRARALEEGRSRRCRKLGAIGAGQVRMVEGVGVGGECSWQAAGGATSWRRLAHLQLASLMSRAVKRRRWIAAMAGSSGTTRHRSVTPLGDAMGVIVATSARIIAVCSTSCIGPSSSVTSQLGASLPCK
ncbi:hypothetical protein BRADI_2g01694v3 [Brachypodium distachyon]|uniref:Uncharacterized protein n=1 Tax=Brachypodium distachyon TaxID=15368 RepID=A0A0Q3FST6_BRADI|nr:hypothetical protein BRADI_2g01694v3 [Brachypodium distachyon]